VARSDHPSDVARILAEYQYDLPPEAIAQRPAEPRDAARLLVLPRAGVEKARHHHVRDLPELLAPGDLLVLNDTRVMLARLLGNKLPGGGKAEVLLVRELDGHYWEALVGCSGRKRPGLRIDLGGGYRIEVVEPLESATWKVALQGPGTAEELMASTGHVPLPPYIRRPDDAADRESYQTVFARRPGAVAAPTAGLHFTPGLLAALAKRGVECTHVTLHVGPGTFRPLEPEDLERGVLHEERYELPEKAARAIRAVRDRGGRIVAAGTTTTRVLETCEGRAGAGLTCLFIRPPYQPRIVDALLTNFHLPGSSLLMLVAAFVDRPRLLSAYAEALSQGYRFYSYGDAMLVL